LFIKEKAILFLAAAFCFLLSSIFYSLYNRYNL
jgi:hypothetical protein